jgi:hypothetical protein
MPDLHQAYAEQDATQAERQRQARRAYVASLPACLRDVPGFANHEWVPAVDLGPDQYRCRVCGAEKRSADVSARGVPNAE